MSPKLKVNAIDVGLALLKAPGMDLPREHAQVMDNLIQAEASGTLRQKLLNSTMPEDPLYIAMLDQCDRFVPEAQVSPALVLGFCVLAGTDRSRWPLLMALLKLVTRLLGSPARTVHLRDLVAYLGNRFPKAAAYQKINQVLATSEVDLSDSWFWNT